MIDEGLFGPSKKQKEADRLKYETEIASYRNKRNSILSLKNHDLTKICPRDLLFLVFSSSSNVNNCDFSDDFVSMIAYEKSGRVANSITSMIYGKDHENTYMRKKELDADDIYKLYHDKYMKRRNSHSMFKDVNDYDSPFSSKGGSAVWFTVEDGNPFLSIYFEIDSKGSVFMNSDGDD